MPEHIVENDGSITLTEKGRQQVSDILSAIRGFGYCSFGNLLSEKRIQFNVALLPLECGKKQLINHGDSLPLAPCDPYGLKSAIVECTVNWDINMTFYRVMLKMNL